MGLAPILPVLLHLLVHDWYYVEFTAWASLPQLDHDWYYVEFTAWASLPLLVHDWYYVEFTAWASLTYSQYYSICWFTTGITCSLLQGYRSHTTSTTPFTGSRLVLRGDY
jgi:hypothetical protein